jgi:predicted nucleic acid-binding protein
MIFADAGFLIALLQVRDQFYRRATAWSNAIQEPILTTEYVLCEFVNSLSRPLTRPKVHASLDSIRAASDWEIVPVSTALFTAGLQLHRQHADKEWSLTDCISFQIMRSRGITRALTHDHHFEQAGFEALLRRDPPEAS